MTLDLPAWARYDEENARARRAYRFWPSLVWCAASEQCAHVARYDGFCSGHKALSREAQRERKATA